MTFQEYIREAVELADGWSVSGFTCDGVSHFTVHINSFDIDIYSDELEPFLTDALAAQLVSQVDALRSEDFQIALQSDFGCTVIWLNGVRKWAVEGQDRIVNSIKVIVDSKVLKNDSTRRHGLLGTYNDGMIALGYRSGSVTGDTK